MICQATTRRGKPCRARAIAGTQRCFAHRELVPPELVDAFVSMLRAGNYVDVAARATGLQLELLPAELRARIDAARAEGEARNVARIADAARENWQAAAWLLERQHPERWGRPAIREPEREIVIAVESTDSVDELAGKRAARRSSLT